MGTFRVGLKVENHVHRRRSATVAKALVDTGSGYTWLPQKTLEAIGVTPEKKDLTFVMANGRKITRSVGFAIVRVGKSFTIDEVVFGLPGDLALLGARSMEGLGLAVDARRKKLVASGPLPVAALFVGRCEGAKVRRWEGGGDFGCWIFDFGWGCS